MPTRCANVILLLGLVSLTIIAGCRSGGADDNAKPEVAPACVKYLGEATACDAKAAATAKPALDAVYQANKTSIDNADTQPKMDAVAEQCVRWSELLAQNPQCQ